MVEPRTSAQAAAIPAWQDAMQLEFEALAANRTWDIIPLPPSRKPIGCKWIYKIKHRADDNIERYKGRLVVRGTHRLKGLIFMKLFHRLSRCV